MCLDNNDWETCCDKLVTNAILICAHTLPCRICTARWRRAARGQCCAHHHRHHAEVCGAGAVFLSSESPVHRSGQEGGECHSLFLTQAVTICHVLFFYHAAWDKSWDTWLVDHCSIIVYGDNISASSHANIWRFFPLNAGHLPKCFMYACFCFLVIS